MLILMMLANLKKAFASLLWAAFMSILFKEIFDPGYKESNEVL